MVYIYKYDAIYVNKENTIMLKIAYRYKRVYEGKAMGKVHPKFLKVGLSGLGVLWGPVILV